MTELSFRLLEAFISGLLIGGGGVGWLMTNGKKPSSPSQQDA